MQIGSLVICETNCGWYDVDTGEDSAGPSYGEITTISGFQEDYLEFEEYPEIGWDGKRGAWRKDLFREIQPPVQIKIEDVVNEKV